MKKNQLAKNVIYSVSAQVISMIVSFLIGLVVPKFIDEYQYAYWQTYTLYVGYVGILHFGIIDGIVLRYSQYDYDELNKKTVRSQFHFLFVLEFLFALITILVALKQSKQMMLVFLFVAIGIVVKNILTFSTYSLQLTNRIKEYASLIIIDRFIYLVLIVLFLTTKINNFVLYCIADLVSDSLAIMFAVIRSKEIYIGKLSGLQETFKEIRINIAAGIFVLIANWSSNLLVGMGKMIVQWRWDQIVFGKISFAFSLSNLFLTFVSAISVVLFPSLKRMDKSELPSLYKNIRGLSSLVLFGALIFYFPGCKILEIWLPKYIQSLSYLGILMPIIIYTSKVSLLTNNYLKAYRKERLMLYINLCSIVIGTGLYLICAYIFNNITMLLFCIVIVIMMRSIVSEIAIMKTINIFFGKEFAIEGVMTILFIISASLFNLIVGATIYLLALVIYIIFNKNYILSVKNNLMKGRKT